MKRIPPLSVVGVLILVLLAACTKDRSIRVSPSEGTQTNPTRRAASPAASAAPTPCPVTLANGATPPGESQSSLNHGNGQLWTVLWPDGIVVASGPDQVFPDGSVEMKFPWWRGVAGRLTIEGHRLDRMASPLRAEMSDYGLTGFQASGLIFPTAGCWEVTGRVKSASLTFVTLVVAR
jgi:hypothetical protein